MGPLDLSQLGRRNAETGREDAFVRKQECHVSERQVTVQRLSWHEPRCKT